MNSDESYLTNTNEAGSQENDQTIALKSQPMFADTPKRLSENEDNVSDGQRNSQIEYQSTAKLSQRMVILDKIGSPAKNKVSNNTTEQSIENGEPSNFQSQDRMPTRLND